MFFCTFSKTPVKSSSVLLLFLSYSYCDYRMAYDENSVVTYSMYLFSLSLKLLNEALKQGGGCRYACGSWNLKTDSYATCDVTVTHDKSAVGVVETK